MTVPQPPITAGIEGFTRFRPLSKTPGPRDVSASKSFLDGSRDDLARYSGLALYFLEGFKDHATADFSHVHYPGLPSIRGYTVTGLEGFARTAPLLAALLFGKHLDPFGPASRGDLADMLRSAVLAGTEVASPSYWGDLNADDQRLVEMPDIARALWLSREYVWDELQGAAKTKLSDWLAQASMAAITRRNNWILFPAVVDAFLWRTGQRCRPDYPTYWEFKHNYLEAGWFFDTPHGVDFYNAWGITYDMFWLSLLDPDLDAAFIQSAIAQSADLTQHLISPLGVPIMGRSIAYRTGIPTAVLCGAHLQRRPVSAGTARRALDAVWRYFIAGNVLRDGTLTMGYLETDPRLVDDYTGPGSCHWGLRPLVLAFMNDAHSHFWTDPQQPLPVERTDFRRHLPKLGWTISGDSTSQEVTIEIPANPAGAIPLDDATLPTRENASQTLRPENLAAKYGQRLYSARAPFPLDGRARD